MTTLSRISLALLASVAAPALAPAAVPLPTGGTLPHVDFERHVMGLLSKTGCNSGSCHGSFQGKNGFRLSLFGYEPSLDHASLTRDNLGRRIDRVSPDNSLVLTKAVGSVAHDGGMRFGKDAWTYAVFREWIRGGATWTPGSGAVAKLSVAPGEFALIPAGRTLQLKVTAAFADGTKEDVTPFCDFKMNDDAIATVTPLGLVTAVRTGDAGVMVQYRGSVAAHARARAGQGPSRRLPGRAGRELHRPRGVRQAADAEHGAVRPGPGRAVPAARHDRRRRPAAFARRGPGLPRGQVAGQADAEDRPAPRRIRSTPPFGPPSSATSPATTPRPWSGPSRRSRGGARCGTTGSASGVQDNVPYDRLVRDILTATSRDDMTAEQYLTFVKRIDAKMDPAGGADEGRMAKGTGFGSEYADKKTLDLFWRRQQQVPIEQWSEKVAAAFMGVRLECAQCHKHPIDRWTQDEYWAFANVFSEVSNFARQFSSKDLKKLADEENDIRTERYTGRNNNNRQPGPRDVRLGHAAGRPRTKPNPMTNAVPTPQAPGGPKLPPRHGQGHPRDAGRLAHGQGQPVLRPQLRQPRLGPLLRRRHRQPGGRLLLANPPTNARLLDALAKEFVESGYDLRAPGTHDPAEPDLPASATTPTTRTSSTRTTTRTPTSAR